MSGSSRYKSNRQMTLSLNFMRVLSLWLICNMHAYCIWSILGTSDRMHLHWRKHTHVYAKNTTIAPLYNSEALLHIRLHLNGCVYALIAPRILQVCTVVSPFKRRKSCEWIINDTKQYTKFLIEEIKECIRTEQSRKEEKTSFVKHLRRHYWPLVGLELYWNAEYI